MGNYIVFFRHITPDQMMQSSEATPKERAYITVSGPANEYDIQQAVCREFSGMGWFPEHIIIESYERIDY